MRMACILIGPYYVLCIPHILMRELVTAGQVKRVPRTENNPHGLLITNWRTLLNKDIEQKSKSNF